MEQQLKQRLLGTIIMVAVAVIVLPLLLDGEGYRAMQRIEIEAPQRPEFGYRQDGFTIPIENLNNQNDLLNPPQPIDIKGFNGDAAETKPSEEARANEEGGTSDTLDSEADETKPSEEARANEEGGTSDTPDSEADETKPSEEARADEEGGTSDTPDSEAKLTTTWVIQVGSFSIEENALAVRNKLEAMEVKNTVAEIETEKVGGQEVHVVKIVSNDYEALSELTQLIKKDYPDAFIKERE